MLKIEIVSIKPRVTKEEQIVVDVEAALYEKRNGDPTGGIRIPNITFEVKTSIANATGISSERGYFEKTDILINTCEEDEQENTTAKLTIAANYIEQDESKKAIEEITVDISEQLASVYQIKQARKEKEATKLAKEEATRMQKVAENERKKLQQEMYEKLEPDRKRQIKADITKAGEDIKSRERLQLSPFNVLREYADHPHAERTAVMVGAEAPERTIEAVEIYKLAGWASKVMKIATEKQPLMAIKNIAKYKDMDWAPEILKVAAQRHPHEVVKALSQYCEYEWCREIIFHIAETEPQAAFEEVEMWEFYPWAEEAAMVAANKAPEFTINNFALYQDQPWAQRIYESVAISGKFTSAEKAEAQRLLKKKITEAGTKLLHGTNLNENFAILYEHRFHPHSKVVMTNVAEENPGACIEAIRIYKSAKWAKEIMLVATAKSPLVAIDRIDEYIEMEWAEDVMKKAADLKPKEAIRLLPKYAGYTWSKSIVESISISSPDSIFQEMEFIEYQPWAETVVGNAASRKPEKALALQSRYQNQPWAEIIMGESMEQIYCSIINAINASIFRGAKSPQYGIDTQWKECDFRHKDEYARTKLKALSGATNPIEPSSMDRLLASITEVKRLEDFQEKAEKQRLKLQAQSARTRGHQGVFQAASSAIPPVVVESDHKKEKERDISRRNALLKIVGLAGIALTGYNFYKWWGFRKLLQEGKIDMENIKKDPDKILTKDIRSILTDENLKEVLGECNMAVLFEKTEDGSYRYSFPESIVEKLTSIMDNSTGKLEEGYVDFNLYPTIVSDGIVTIDLKLYWHHYGYEEGYATGLFFKDYHPSRSWRIDDKQMRIHDWLVMKVDKVGEGSSFKVTLTLKQTPLRPISESVEFIWVSGYISDIVHHAEIQDSYISTYKSEVVHSLEGQTTIKEKRRKRAVEEKFGK